MSVSPVTSGIKCQVTIPDKYQEILQIAGDLQVAVGNAIRRYALELASEQIEECEKEITHFQNKCGCSYETFLEDITNGDNPEFLDNLNHRYPTWEVDFNVWETYLEELQRWNNRVRKLLTD
ncbi:TPA: hypothetical protein EYP66_17710 [Candidatus Poribacteria bacterium]|nr:hypothetical protein [Candidatus Poribacteria bacterium]